MKDIPQLPRKKFYFVRHGETEANANPHHKRVDYDLPLNERGKQQALTAREIVLTLAIRRVYCSPIQRAQQTKNLIFQGSSVRQVDDDRLRECPAAVWTAMVEGKDSDAVQTFQYRVLEGVAAALKEEGPILIVAHGGIHWALCHHMALDIGHPWAIGNCDVVHFQPVEGMRWKAEIL